VNQLPNDLHWRPDSVANILHNNGICTREQLAQRTTMSRATIYRVFDAGWSGTATLTVLVRMAYCFRAPLAALVKEPARAA
jgi:hypothetical protein